MILFCLSIEGNYGKYLITWPHFGFQDKLKERERELRKRKEREEQEMERVRIKVRRKEAIVSYQALLVETIKDPQVLFLNYLFQFQVLL